MSPGAILAGTVGPGLLYGGILTLAGTASAVLLARNADQIQGPPVVVAFPVICLSVGGWFLLPALRTALSRWRLYRNGVATTGRVTGRQATGVHLENRRVIATAYEFDGPDGAVEGAVSHLSAPPGGSEVTVLYDPARPSRNLLVLPGAFGRVAKPPRPREPRGRPSAGKESGPL